MSALRVLVVDDEMLIRWSLSEALSLKGCAVSEAGDGREAMQALTGDDPPDVVVLDYKLPDTDGLSLLAKIRQSLPSGQVILMTAFGTQEVTHGALNLGAYRVVNKPFELDDMTALVREAHASVPQH